MTREIINRVVPLIITYHDRTIKDFTPHPVIFLYEQNEKYYVRNVTSRDYDDERCKICSRRVCPWNIPIIDDLGIFKQESCVKYEQLHILEKFPELEQFVNDHPQMAHHNFTRVYEQSQRFKSIEVHMSKEEIQHYNRLTK